MELNEIRQIIELMEKHGLTSFSLRRDGNELKLRKGADLDAVQKFLSQLPHPQMMQQPAQAVPPMSSHAVVTETPPASPMPVKAEEPVGQMIKSPMVGTFYLTPGPNEPLFVKEGDRVGPDTVVCIIEAMKVMNEIKAETSGVIKRVMVESGKPVQYGQPLFELQA